ncbi:MAG: ribosome-associated translation inhibitor RaiA [Clostridia bacterium]|nr:ribosome-associated translation inhibitor RaiA [Clostridia bacterium]
MNIKLTGKNIDLTDGLKERVDDKMSKLDKYFNKDVDAQVTLKVQKLDQIAEVTIPLKGTILRAEVKDKDMYNSIDTVVSKLEKQLQKFRSKLRDKHRDDNVFVGPMIEDDKDEYAEEIQISKEKHFEFRPMSDEEAIMQLNLLDHDFYVYKDTKDFKVRVVYAKADGTYGIITEE